MNIAGYYTHISTLADVQENVMEYLHVLSRPMVINHDHDIIWTEAYMDSVVRHNFLKLLLFFLLSNVTTKGNLPKDFLQAIFPQMFSPQLPSTKEVIKHASILSVKLHISIARPFG